MEKGASICRWVLAEIELPRRCGRIAGNRDFSRTPFWVPGIRLVRPPTITPNPLFESYELRGAIVAWDLTAPPWEGSSDGRSMPIAGRQPDCARLSFSPYLGSFTFARPPGRSLSLLAKVSRSAFLPVPSRLENSSGSTDGIGYSLGGRLVRRLQDRRRNRIRTCSFLISFLLPSRIEGTRGDIRLLISSEARKPLSSRSAPRANRD